MVELTRRSRSQILQSFLPQQTADINGKIYRVDSWQNAFRPDFDDATVRSHLLREVTIFSRNGNDGGLESDVRSGERIELTVVNPESGVRVERYPRVWLCSRCRRIGKRTMTPCRCGNRDWSQVQFIGFHSCGATTEPRIPRCPTHDDVRLPVPGSTRITDIELACPECHVVLQRGLGFVRCPCGTGNFTWNVHKARNAYTPCRLTMVNPAEPARLQRLQQLGGPRVFATWLLDGLTGSSPSQSSIPTREAIIESLVAAGLPRAVAEQNASGMVAAGHAVEGDTAEAAALLDQVPLFVNEVTSIATAIIGVRTRIEDVLEATTAPAQRERLEIGYPRALSAAGLAGIDLIDSFPVLTGMYGFTRGGGPAGTTRLVAFRNHNGGYRIHAEQQETEALFVRLDPTAVFRWLTSRGHTIPGVTAASSPREIRAAIARACDIPPVGADDGSGTPGEDLLKLVHTFSHRMIRLTSAIAGIDRDALAEYLVPLNLGFFMYASARGAFVLGGLQAMFETELDLMLNTLTSSDHRCPLDPGCSHGKAACSACLHVGEPSCRAYNSWLSRHVLFGPTGYLAGQ